MNSNQEQSGGEESIALQYIYIYYFLPDNNTFVSIGAYLRTCLLTIVTKNYYSWFRMMATVLALTLTLILLRSSLSSSSSSSSLSTSNEITITSTTSIVDSNKEDNYIDIFEMEQQPSNEEGQQQQQQMIFKKKNSPLRQRRSVLVLVIYYYYF